MAAFTGKVAVITGAGTGIGLATARRLASEGADVVMAGRDADRGRREAAAVVADGGHARFVPTDVTDDGQVARLADDAASATGTIDLWFNNAGIEGPIGAIEDWDDPAIAELLAVNVKGVLSGLRHATALMGEGGLVVNNASFVGTAVAVPIAVPYGATKAAVASIGASAAVALAQRGIRVVTLCPWIVDTPMVDRLTDGAGAEARDDFAAGYAPSGVLTPPEHLAELVAGIWEGTRTITTGGAYLVDAGPKVTPIAAFGPLGGLGELGELGGSAEQLSLSA